MKSKVKDRGIIVKTYPYGESSLIIKCFTQEHGMISVIAKGIRQKPEASMLTSLGSFDLTLYEPGEGEIYLLSEFSPRNTHDFSSRMECWATAECALELFGQILIPVEETPHYYAFGYLFAKPHYEDRAGGQRDDDHRRRRPRIRKNPVSMKPCCDKERLNGTKHDGHIPRPLVHLLLIS